jgi:type II secretory pathway pseudopilin PulG
MPVKKQKKQKAFTLIEILVYSVILVTVVSVVVGFLFWALKNNARSKASTESQDNARRAIEIMSSAIRQSISVYTPTSIFDVNPGQLSLETKISPPTGETKTYKDFFVENYKLYLKEEGKSPEQITSDQVSVSSLVFKYLSPASGLENVQIDIIIDYNAPAGRSEFQSSTHLISTAVARGY